MLCDKSFLLNANQLLKLFADPKEKVFIKTIFVYIVQMKSFLLLLLE